jgi:HAD superfamily hydrolase (TIGR01509 family)
MTWLPLRLVIFDCDGVLMDSEPASRLVLMEEARALGLPLTEAGAHAFTGQTWQAIKPAFEAAIGRLLPDLWPQMLRDRVIARMAHSIQPIPGARAVLEATAALGLPYRIASNSSHAEMATKFGGTGMADLVAGRTISAGDVPRGKPAPDIFLAAAGGVEPRACIVVEDSTPGITGAQAAGMRVIAYAPEGLPPGLARAPDAIITSLAELPPLFAAATRPQAA